MQTRLPKDDGRSEPQEQKEHRKHVTAQEGDTIELRVEELEERIAPRLASNHNETFLVD